MKVSVRLAACCLMAAFGVMSAGTHVLAVNAIATGNWSGAGTWNPAEPVAGDSTTIDGGFTVSVDQAGEASGTLDIGTIAGQTGGLSIAALGDLQVSGGALPCIRVGQATGSTGTLDMTGGNVFIAGGFNTPPGIGELIVGDNGTGTMNMSDGALHASDEIWIGAQPGSTGTVNVSGGQFQSDGRSILVGFNGNANLNVSGTGAVKANWDMLVGFLAGATSNINLSGGTIEAGFMFSNFDNPGVAPGSTVVINQTGGTYNTRIAYVMGRGPGTTTLNHSAGAINVTVNPNGDFVVSDGNLNTSTYNISGTATTAVARDFVAGTFGGSNGTVNQTGGSITTGRNLRIGADGIGHWNLSGGTVNATNAFLGDFDTSDGFVKVSGGTLALSGNLSVGAALASNAPPAPVGTQGQAVDANGTFTVSGSGGTINVGGQLLANPGDHTRALPGTLGDNVSTLVWEILNNTGVSEINVTGAANLNAANIDVSLLGGSFPLGSTFDLITASTISNNYVQALEDVGTFSLAIVPGGNGQILRATLVPEPAASVLLCCAAGGFVCQRRRVRAKS